MRSELRGCAGFRDLSPGFRDLSPGFRDFWNLVSHHCVSFYGPSGFRGFIRVPGFLDFCFPSLCFFWFGTCFPGSGTFGTLSPIIVFSFYGPSGRGTSSGFRDSWTLVSHHCVFSCGLSGLRDSWNLVSHHCVCSVVHQGAGLHQGFRDSWTFVSHHCVFVFFLVVYQGSGIFGTLSPIIVFVLWSIRARDFIRVPGFLDSCFPSLCFFWFRDLSPEFQDLSPGFRDLWNLVSHHCVFSCGL